MVYLNYAALSPTRAEAQQVVESTLAEFNSLLYSDLGLIWYQDRISGYRNTVAELLSVPDPSTIAFLPNASMASHVSLSFIDWHPGEVILTTTHENPSVVREMNWLTHRGVQIRTIDPTSPEDLLGTLESQLSTQPIKVILLSHVSHVDGRVFPVSEIGRMARKYKTLFLIDGAQAVGHIPVNLEQFHFDLYFFPGHKWCKGPLGTGALIMHESYLTHNPAFELAGLGWNGTPAGRLEIGTHNIGLVAGFAKACQLLSLEGLKMTEQEMIRQGAHRTLENFHHVVIRQWAGAHSPGILTFQCSKIDTHRSLMEHLENQEKIALKQFLDYPSGETPAIRLSWSGTEDQEPASFALKSMNHFLNLT